MGKSKALIAAFLCLLLTGCIEEEGNKRPWAGYAWNFAKKRYEFFFSDYETARDCLESMKAQVAPGQGNAEWYSTPVGCFYHGNEYWRVWLMNTLLGGEQLGCIRRNTSASAEKGFYQYSVQLKGADQAATPDSYCV